MTTPLEITGDLLVSELWARDVLFLMGEQTSPAPLLDPVTLIQSLAQSGEARARMALIPLFLRHPEFSSEVVKADEGLSPSDQLYLRFYYTATVLLQKNTGNDWSIFSATKFHCLICFRKSWDSRLAQTLMRLWSAWENIIRR